MKNITRITALALAVGGIALVGCEGETEVQTTDTSREVERSTDNLARDMEQGMDEFGRNVEDTGEAIADGTRDLTDRAREAGAEMGENAREAGADMRDDAGEAARAAERETRQTERELGDTAERATNGMEREDDTRTAVNPLRTGSDSDQDVLDAGGIRSTVASATEAALTEDGFDDLVERFVDADRNRIGEFIRERDNFDDLNQKAQAVRDLFQQKYGAEFAIDDESAVYTDQFATIRQGEIGQARQAAASDDPDANREEGRNVAGVMIAESHGLPQLTVNMIHEFPARWKIDVPDNMSGQHLYNNLSRALDELASNQDQWPEDKADAQRYITHRLMLAIHGENTGMDQGGMN